MSPTRPDSVASRFRHVPVLLLMANLVTVPATALADPAEADQASVTQTEIRQKSSEPASPATKKEPQPVLLDDAAFGEMNEEGSVEPAREWYGGVLLIVDGISATLMLTGVAAESYDVLFPVGAALLITDGLIVHTQLAGVETDPNGSSKTPLGTNHSP